MFSTKYLFLILLLAACYEEKAKEQPQTADNVHSSDSNRSLAIASALSISTTGGTSQTPACQVKIINGILEVCCDKPYGAGQVCTNYADDFNNLCKLYGLKCDFVPIYCDGENTGHMTNSVILSDGSKCLVDATSGQMIGCDPPTPWQTLICKAMGKGPDCKCADYVADIKANPQILVDDIRKTDPNYCKEKNPNRNECMGCCFNQVYGTGPIGGPVEGGIPCSTTYLKKTCAQAECDKATSVCNQNPFSTACDNAKKACDDKVAQCYSDYKCDDWLKGCLSKCNEPPPPPP